jgi:hypothetical protein
VISDRGLIAYEYFGKTDQDFAALAGQDSAGGASTLYSPQYVIGGGWQTSLSIVNLSTIPGNVSLRLIGDGGTQIGTTQTLQIGASGKIFISSDAFFGPEIFDSASQVQGYIEITGDGLRLGGSVVFGNASNSFTSTALPLVSTLQRSLVFSHVASSDTYFTGLAIVNPHAQDATAKIDLYGPDGTLENSVKQTIRAGRRTSRLLTGYFPSLVGQTRLSGYIRVTVDQDVGCFALLGTNDLTVLSAIPAQPAQ